MAANQPAVMVNAAYKYYGRESNPKIVLNYLNMTVERGTIYGLLGPSGCGKTTLLSCIVGRRRLDSGEVWVLGGKPGTKGSGVPGPLIGYMPQDIALIGEFTVRDAVYYFGRVFGLESSRLEARFEFLSKLLELPDSSKLLKHLSGGQQRRVSFAAALVQEPDLLILDEPTVGLDPVLRERIWNYLVDISKAGASVIITTHYIDETKQAHKIGLMRGGKLLAEESPLALMNKFSTETLEEAFLILSVKQSQIESRRQEVHAFDNSGTSADFQLSMNKSDSLNMNNYNSKEDFTKMCTSSTDALADSQRDLCSEQNKSLKARGYNTGQQSRYKALFIKNLQQFARHPGGLIFSALFPIVQILAFFCSVGHDPRQLPLAVVNLEAINSPFGFGICHNSSLVTADNVDEDTCNLYMLGCRFLNELDNLDMRQLQFDNLEEAYDSARRGKTVGVLYMAKNFSKSLEERFKYGTNTDDGTVDTSAIIVRLDMSNHQIAHYVRKSLYDTYERFARGLMIDCGREVELAELPVRFLQPVYGSLEPSYSTFMAPGIMFTILFFLSATVTSTLMIAERLEGIWDRSVVAGVKPKEILFVHIFIQSIIILFQTIELMVLAFAGYGVPYRGSLVTLGLLLFLQGLSGMCYGFLLSVLCNSYTLAFFVSTGSFYPMILLCGILWPLEGMSKGLRWIALCLPFTIPTRSVRDIMEKGFSITHPSVYTGYLVTLVWIVTMISLCLLRLKWKKS